MFYLLLRFYSIKGLLDIGLGKKLMVYKISGGKWMGYGILWYRERIVLIFVNGINWDWGIFRLKIINMWEIYILFFNIFLSLIIVKFMYCILCVFIWIIYLLFD